MSKTQVFWTVVLLITTVGVCYKVLRNLATAKRTKEKDQRNRKAADFNVALAILKEHREKRDTLMRSMGLNIDTTFDPKLVSLNDLGTSTEELRKLSKQIASLHLAQASLAELKMKCDPRDFDSCREKLNRQLEAAEEPLERLKVSEADISRYREDCVKTHLQMLAKIAHRFANEDLPKMEKAAREARICFGQECKKHGLSMERLDLPPEVLETLKKPLHQ